MVEVSGFRFGRRPSPGRAADEGCEQFEPYGDAHGGGYRCVARQEVATGAFTRATSMIRGLRCVGTISVRLVDGE